MNIVLWYPSMFTVEFKITRYVLTRLSKAGVAIAASDRTVLDPANACFKVKEKLLYFPWHQMHRVWLEKSMNFWQASSCHKLWGNLGLWRSMPWCIRSFMIGTIKANQVVRESDQCTKGNRFPSLSYLVWVKNGQETARTRICSILLQLSTWIYLVQWAPVSPSVSWFCQPHRVWCLTGHQHWQVWSKWGKIHRRTCFNCKMLDWSWYSSTSVLNG